MEDGSPPPLSAAPWLGRVSRACGVFLIVLVFFTPWFAERRKDGPFQVDTCFTLALHRAREVHARGLVLPFRAFDAPNSAARQHAMWSLESPLVILLLASILTGATALALRPVQRKLPRLPLGGALLGTASAATLVLRSALSKHGLYTTDFQDSTLGGELLSWAAALLPLAFGAAAWFSAWQRRPWGKRAVRALAAISVIVLLVPHTLEFESASSFGQEAHWGSRAAVVLFALALILERRRVSALIEPLPESDVPEGEVRQEAPPAPSPSPGEGRFAKVASIAVLVLSVSLLLVLTRRATRPPRLNDPWDDWPLFVDINKPQQHTGPIHGLAFSPKGDLLASGSEDGTVKLWEIPSGKLVRVIQVGDRVSGVAISPDGALLAGSSPFAQIAIRVWTLSDGKLAREIVNDGGTYNVAFAPNGALLGSSSGIVQIWSAADGSFVKTLTLEGYYSAVSPRGDMVATSKFADFAAIWSMRSGSLLRTLEHPGDAACLAFAPSGDVIAACSANRLGLWSASTGQLVRETSIGGMRPACVDFSPDGRLLAWSDVTEGLHVAWTSNLDEVGPVDVRSSNAAETALAVSDRWLAYVHVPNTIRLYRLPDR